MAAPSTLVINADGITAEFESTTDTGTWGTVTIDTAQTLTILIDSGGANERTRVVDLTDPSTAIVISGVFTIATVSINLVNAGVYSGEAVEIVAATAGILADGVITSDAISAATAVTNNSTLAVAAVVITEHTTTATKYAGVCMQTWDVKTSTLGGGYIEQHKVDWKITAYPAGWSYKSVSDPRPGSVAGETIDITTEYVEGWAAAIYPDAAGTYTVTFRITDYYGRVVTGTDSVVITAQAGFTTVYVDGAATGADDGTSPTDAFPTLGAGMAKVVTNGGTKQILSVAGGQTYTDITVAVNDVYTGYLMMWDGTGGSSPIADMTNIIATQTSVLKLDGGSENVVCRGIDFTDSSQISTGTADQTPIDLSTETEFAGVDITIQGAYSVRAGILENTDESDVLFWNCDTSVGAQRYSGCLTTGGSTVVIGGSYGGSLDERPFRCSIGSQTFIGVHVSSNHKSTLRFWGLSDHNSVYKSKLVHGGIITVGVRTTSPGNVIQVGQNANSPGSFRLINSHLTVIDSSTLNQSVLVESALPTAVANRGTLISGCYFGMLNATSLGNTYYSETASQRLTMVGNTIEAISNTSNWRCCWAQPSDLCTIEGNIFIYSGAANADRLFKVVASTSLSVKNNVFVRGDLISSDAWTIGSTSYSFTAFEAASTDVRDNVEASLSLDSLFIPSTTTDISAPDGLLADYNNQSVTIGEVVWAGMVKGIIPVATSASIKTSRIHHYYRR